ncbi:hypothetical protein Mmar10_2469 [Maricaulis maris MCS10]|uniref:Uncharacterized protein n=1 Tax=Maricaulis maris (strain MCS10) TaxID=394221 RepID=Q0ALT4_MARMM|nr:hypothetical protein Mmar10_2469 [Maricaulis maris MCS10]
MTRQQSPPCNCGQAEAEEQSYTIPRHSFGERGRFLPAGTEIARIQTVHRDGFELTLSPSDAGLVEAGQTGALILRGQLDQVYAIRVLSSQSPDPQSDQANGLPSLVATALVEVESETDMGPGQSRLRRSIPAVGCGSWFGPGTLWNLSGWRHRHS